jgi:hypothetical protein
MTTAGRKTTSWPQDSTYVDVNRENEVEFWSKQFRVSPGKLKQTVRAVGPKFKDVEQHLKSRR